MVKVKLTEGSTKASGTTIIKGLTRVTNGTSKPSSPNQGSTPPLQAPSGPKTAKKS